MIYIQLFLTFLEIGAVSFGGGYGMIALISEKVTSLGWLTAEELQNFIAVSEVTPGSLAVSVATFVGAEKGGFLGALVATVGVVLPSVIIIVLIASVIKNLLKYSGVQSFLSGIQPAVIGMIIATAVTMGLKTLLSLSTFGNPVRPDVKGLLILAILAAIHILTLKIKKKRPSPIVMILISAGLGLLMYSPLLHLRHRSAFGKPPLAKRKR